MSDIPARTPTEVLEAARWIIDNVGWYQGNWARYDKKGKEVAFCALGAINRVVVDSRENIVQAKHQLASMLPNRYNDQWLPWAAVSSFNDCPITTKQMVLDLFDRAIEKGNK